MEHIPLTTPKNPLHLNQIKSDIKNLNPLDPYFYFDLHQTALNHRYQILKYTSSSIKIHALMPEKSTKMLRNAPSHNVKESEKESWIHPFHPDPHQKLMWSILGHDHPLAKFHGNPLCSYCVILLTNQPSSQKTIRHSKNTTSLAGVIR